MPVARVVRREASNVDPLEPELPMVRSLARHDHPGGSDADLLGDVVNVENLFDEENAVALGRRTDKVFLAIKSTSPAGPKGSPRSLDGCPSSLLRRRRMAASRQVGRARAGRQVLERLALRQLHPAVAPECAVQPQADDHHHHQY